MSIYHCYNGNEGVEVYHAYTLAAVVIVKSVA